MEYYCHIPLGMIDMATKCKAPAAVSIDINSCAVRTAMDVIDGKWKPLILYFLKFGKQRFGRLRRNIPEAPRKVLTDQLRQLESDGLVQRAIRRRPLEVEYSLTEYGETLVPILTMLAEWGERHKQIKLEAGTHSGKKESPRGENEPASAWIPQATLK